jgi:hypothetical protein
MHFMGKLVLEIYRFKDGSSFVNMIDHILYPTTEVLL